ncbi:6-phosphogluconolactonase [Autumnicola musiva]|uniref:6-phosphogluconolactonase n=1 Tax=Autumnicola musiva TaxID=3075589 RepID=A0ABU3D6N0_9FLAO|nr:6-phosphogluconolactonase [Zunongwangia sp. F117]MDT0677191.1 6-phosphogluconolactonase [Zunongwangia sp. F117]
MKIANFPENVHVFVDRESTAMAAGRAVEKCIEKLQEEKETIRMIFAAAPSQDGMLDYLVHSSTINWHKIIAFNMDEYIGLPKDSPQLFATYLEKRLFSKVDLKERFTINSEEKSQEEIGRFTDLINDGTIDIVCLGIGENGHIAFNDPPVADFNDPDIIKVVELDEACRLQQVNEGLFDSLEKVPEKALTLTIPTLMKGEHLFCVVLGENKSEAVENALTGPIATSCPASILTEHPNCEFFFDEEAFGAISFDESSAQRITGAKY